MRIPKLRGFKNRFKIEYEVVNLGAIAHLVELGALEGDGAQGDEGQGRAAAPITVNQEILRAVGLVRTLDKPMKILGHGEIDDRRSSWSPMRSASRPAPRSRPPAAP